MKYHTRGIVFGVFDGLHDGHRHFLSAAAKCCDTLVVVVAPDEAARALKGSAPKLPLAKRIAAVAAFDARLLVVAGDTRQGSWDILEKESPDVVILGYDQHALARELRSRAIPYICLPPHEPERFKSSILNGRRGKYRGSGNAPAS